MAHVGWLSRRNSAGVAEGGLPGGTPVFVSVLRKEEGGEATPGLSGLPGLLATSGKTEFVGFCAGGDDFRQKEQKFRLGGPLSAADVASGPLFHNDGSNQYAPAGWSLQRDLQAGRRQEQVAAFPRWRLTDGTRRSARRSQEGSGHQAEVRMDTSFPAETRPFAVLSFFPPPAVHSFRSCGGRAGGGGWGTSGGDARQPPGSPMVRHPSERGPGGVGEREAKCPAFRLQAHLRSGLSTSYPRNVGLLMHCAAGLPGGGAFGFPGNV